MDSAWRRKAANITALRVHDLRRTVGSWQLVQDGASLHLVGAVLNQKDPKTTAGYAYFQTQQRQLALDQHGENLLAASTAEQTKTTTENSARVLNGIPGPKEEIRRMTREALFVRV
jgi:hypothetical protein